MELQTRTKRANPTNVASVTHEWGAVDAKGRVIGLMIKTRELDYVEQTDGSCSFYTVPVGHYFTADMQMTKDGKPWGACQPEQRFASAEERAAAIVKRLAAAIKKNPAK